MRWRDCLNNQLKLSAMIIHQETLYANHLTDCLFKQILWHANKADCTSDNTFNIEPDSCLFQNPLRPDKIERAENDALIAALKIKSAVKVPVYAIGGINKENARSVVDAGADAICVISAVVSQKDPAEAAGALREIIA